MPSGATENPWAPTQRYCSCCEVRTLFARLTTPGADGFGRSLYTYICQLCDLGTAPEVWQEAQRGFRADPPPDVDYGELV